MAPPIPPLRRIAAVAVVLLLAPCTAVRAQRPAPPDAPCDYRACAYNIIAALHGLRVVAGEQERQVATLGFLYTRDISDAFEGEGRMAAIAAVHTRRWGALFTDVGLALLATGALQAVRHDVDQRSATMMMAGAASVGPSVPLQFLADKHLARAVWQHNARYATPR